MFGSKCYVNDAIRCSRFTNVLWTLRMANRFCRKKWCSLYVWSKRLNSKCGTSISLIDSFSSLRWRQYIRGARVRACEVRLLWRSFYDQVHPDVTLIQNQETRLTKTIAFYSWIGTVGFCHHPCKRHLGQTLVTQMLAAELRLHGEEGRASCSRSANNNFLEPALHSITRRTFISR